VLDILFSAIGVLSAFTIIFIFVALGYAYYKLRNLSKMPPSPPLIEDEK
jgi:hypothetical protein